MPVDIVTPPPTTDKASISSWLRKYRWKLLPALIVVVLLVVLAVRWWRGPLLAASVVEQRDFVQTVVASGHVETAHRVDVGVQITGTVARVPVAEGQSVAQGDLLIALETGELRATQRQTDVAVVQAQVRLRQLREVQAPVAVQTLRQAQATLDNARSLLQRNQDLAKQGFISAAALQDLARAVEVADAQVHATQKQMETTRATGSDYALAEASVAEARANTQAAGARTRYALIYAPAAGVLISRDVEVGDVVQPGKVLMTLSPVGRTQLVVDIDEKNLSLLTLGQHAIASADAYAQQRFPALLTYINPGVNATTGAVEVKLDVPAPLAVLRQDMTVSVDIEVARRPNAVVVPASAVHDAAGVAPWVLRMEGPHAVRHAVQLGLNSGGFAEVRAGLSKGDVVIVASTPVTPGARVRVTVPGSAADAVPVLASAPSAATR